MRSVMVASRNNRVRNAELGQPKHIMRIMRGLLTWNGYAASTTKRSIPDVQLGAPRGSALSVEASWRSHRQDCIADPVMLAENERDGWRENQMVRCAIWR
jgi:hypothetical protein